MPSRRCGASATVGVHALPPRFACRARQEDLHGRALAAPALDTHAAVRLLGEAEDLAEAEPSALADLLGGEERLESLGADLVAHAVAGVADGDDDVFARLRLLRPARGAAHDGVAGLDGEAAADLHRVARVDREVEDHQLDLRRVDQRRPEMFGEHRLDADRTAHRALQQVAQVGDGAVEVERLGLEALPARKGEQLCAVSLAPRSAADSMKPSRRSSFSALG